jgi:hypothetical protein
MDQNPVDTLIAKKPTAIELKPTAVELKQKE